MQPFWFEEEKFKNKIINSDSFVNCTGRKRISLNGKWNYAFDQYDLFFKQDWYEEERKKIHASGENSCYDYSFNHWDTIDIPSTINVKVPEGKFYESTLLFTRKFDYTPGSDNKVFLRVGAAGYMTAVTLNGKYLGRHEGASTPFMVDITDKLKRRNRLFLAVDCKRCQDRLPMQLTDWFNYGGVFRDVELVELPESYIKDWFVRLKRGSGFGTISADVFLKGAAKGPVTLEIPELGIKTESEPGKDGKTCFEFKASPELWCPENPVLYDVLIKWQQDTVKDRIGFREITVKGRDILLNGKPIWLKGVSQHEESVENGRCLTKEEVKRNFEILKELNCNYTRLAHYPHNEYVSELADEKGILLWEEVPVYWDIMFDNKEVYKDAENQLTELIIRDRNRASVIIWSVGNENKDTDERFTFMTGLAKKARELDDSRLVSAACLAQEDKFRDRLIESLDLIGFNQYYGWYEPTIDPLLNIEKGSMPPKPVIITETG
ncbi:MAG: glycoside hydrolase family 2 protein, partial [Fibrobacterota bacterium]